ncbi:MAG TPA: SRPBCC family protein [Dermatophilaceae bacterium]|nr:SRPBCC family protein [Dermatophilaceae bacterium]
MITLERTVRTTAPIEAVHAYLADFTHTEEWDPGTVRTTRELGDGGVGTRYTNVSKFAGREATLSYVVQQVSAPDLVQLRGQNKSLTVTDTMRLRRLDDGGTEVGYRAEFDFQGVARWFEPVLRLPLKRLGDKAQLGMTEALAKL